jgi:ABC-type nitrate/sulfonate/bicarbonate transport system permease component
MFEGSGYRKAEAYRAQRRVLPPLVVGVVGLCTWWIASATGAMDASRWPSPLSIANAATQTVAEPTFWASLQATTTTWLIALLVTTSLGAFLGLLVGNSATAYQLVILPVEFLRPIPAVAILPLLLLILGPTPTTVVWLAVFASFWPLFIQTVYGVRETDPVLRDTARSFRLTRLQMLRRVVLPSALPSMATGLRLAASISLVLTVTVELIVGIDGLGKSIFLAQNGGQIARMYVLIAVTGVLGILVATVFRHLERILLHWHQSQRLLITEDA